ncbi:MAG: alpha/beta hydrolase family protein [Desulfobaccales bacterium]
METRRIILPISPERRCSVEIGIPRSATMDAVLILGHGANNTMYHPLIAGVQQRLARNGVVTVRFNFPYAEEGKKRPDPDPVLEGVFRLVLEYVAELEEFRGLELFLGGKSMGARLAAQIVAQDVGASGLVFLGYPLHPPGKPEQLRDRPLLALPCPTLFIQGGHDPFCQLHLLGQVLAHLPVRADLHVLPGLGHSFERGSGSMSPDTLEEIVRVILAWLDSL